LSVLYNIYGKTADILQFDTLGRLIEYTTYVSIHRNWHNKLNWITGDSIVQYVDYVKNNVLGKSTVWDFKSTDKIKSGMYVAFLSYGLSHAQKRFHLM